MPTGLSAGKTLADLDLVGRRQTDGKRIYAQCKKHEYPVNIDSRFLELASADPGSILYYCQYGGVIGSVPPHVQVFSKKEAFAWAETPRGKSYVAVLL